jgi:hypothetical protein
MTASNQIFPIEYVVALRITAGRADDRTLYRG